MPLETEIRQLAVLIEDARESNDNSRELRYRVARLERLLNLNYGDRDVRTSMERHAIRRFGDKQVSRRAMWLVKLARKDAKEPKLTPLDELVAH